MRRRAWSICSLLTATWLVAVIPAHADGMRCGTKLVSDGDPTYRVRSVCGAPDSEVRRTELRTVRHWVSAPCVNVGGGVRCGYFAEQTVPVLIDEWIYDFGPHEFVRHLVFEQDRLIQLKTGGYGVKLK